jgi:hypothetical protein
MESFFGMRQSKKLSGVNVMVLDALYSLALQYLDNPCVFNFQMLPYYGEGIIRKCDLAAKLGVSYNEFGLYGHLDRLGR